MDNKYMNTLVWACELILSNSPHLCDGIVFSQLPGIREFQIHLTVIVFQSNRLLDVHMKFCHLAIHHYPIPGPSLGCLSWRITLLYVPEKADSLQHEFLYSWTVFQVLGNDL